MLVELGDKGFLSLPVSILVCAKDSPSSFNQCSPPGADLAWVDLEPASYLCCGLLTFECRATLAFKGGAVLLATLLLLLLLRAYFVILGAGTDLSYLSEILGPSHKAVSGIDFTVGHGEFFGFLGPNGAGKTTTMKILSTLLRKTSGRAVVAGFDVDKQPKAVRKNIGFAMQEVGLDDLATGKDFLVLQGVLYGLSGRAARLRAGEMLELIGLSSVARQKVGAYSGGMRRRIDLAAALMHSPPLLFLDEPTVGLDPQSRLAIWEHLTQINRQGVTIFLTTQMMEEADHLCERIAIVDRGQIVADGSPGSLKADVGGDVVHIALDPASVDADGELANKAGELVRGLDYVDSVNSAEAAISITVKDGSAAVPGLVLLLHENLIPIASLSVASPTLDDVFLKQTGRTIRSEEASGDEAAQMMRPMMGLNKR